MIGQRKPKKHVHISDFTYHKCTTLLLSLPMWLSTRYHFPFYQELYLFHYFPSAYVNSVIQSQKSRALSLATGLDDWLLTRWLEFSVLGGGNDRHSTWDSELSMPQPDFNLCSRNQNPSSSCCRLRLPEIKSFITSHNEQFYILQKQQLLKVTTSELVKMSSLTIKTLYILMKILLIFSPCPTFYFIYSNSNE